MLPHESAAPSAFVSDPDRACRRTVFILGPSHHKYTPRCALSQASSYETPAGADCSAGCSLHGELILTARHPGDLVINAAVVEGLRATRKFEDMSLAVDEVRHTAVVQQGCRHDDQAESA